MSTKFSRNKSRVQPTPAVCKKVPDRKGRPPIVIVCALHSQDPYPEGQWTLDWFVCNRRAPERSLVTIEPRQNMDNWHLDTDALNCDTNGTGTFINHGPPGLYQATFRLHFTQGPYLFHKEPYTVIPAPEP